MIVHTRGTSGTGQGGPHLVQLLLLFWREDFGELGASLTFQFLHLPLLIVGEVQHIHRVGGQHVNTRRMIAAFRRTGAIVGSWTIFPRCFGVRQLRTRGRALRCSFGAPRGLRQASVRTGGNQAGGRQSGEKGTHRESPVQKHTQYNHDSAAMLEREPEGKMKLRNILQNSSYSCATLFGRAGDVRS
jgi:hypothetical protein